MARSTDLEALTSQPDHRRYLGPYRLIRELGAGGFAPVWLAAETYGDQELRKVAVKLFPLKQFKGGLGAIVDEAKALCRVEHPNVVRFFALTTDPAEKVLGLAMEFLAGSSLREIMRDKPSRQLSALDVVQVGHAMASALTAVHQVGLIHRDVKPENVFLVDGVYKLIDFGVASPKQQTTTVVSAVTSARVVLLGDLPLQVQGDELSARSEPATGDSPLKAPAGTVGYIDPESFRAEPTPLSDVYSLGAMLYECLTGWLPSVAASRKTQSGGPKGEVLDGREPPPPIREIMPGAPDALANLIDKMIAPSAADRPSSAEAVAWELERIRLDLLGTSRPLPPEEIGPFRGLGRFEGADRDVYFGRSTEIAAGLELLRTRGLVAFVGASGTGKSSLARAGVVPLVTDGLLGIRPKDWDARVVTPGRDPRQAIETALTSWMGPMEFETPSAWVSALAAHVTSTKHGLLLVIDQLEELVTLTYDSRYLQDSQKWSVDFLVQLGQQPLLGLRCLVAIRRDLLDPLLSLGDLGKLLTRGTLLVSAFSARLWADVVDQAIAAYGYRFEDSAMREEILRELEQSSAAMPLVQFALTELWQGRDRQQKLIPKIRLATLGGISGALHQYAERVRTDMSDSDKGETLRRVLLAMTTPQGTRRILSDAEVSTIHPSAPAIIATLEEHRLCVREASGVTLAHEALLSQWRTLASWLAEVRGARMLAADVTNDASSWDFSREADRLWRGRRLIAARTLLESDDVQLEPIAREFVRASLGAQWRERAWRIAGGIAVVIAVVVSLTIYIVQMKREQAKTKGALEIAQNLQIRAEEQTRLAQVSESQAKTSEKHARDSERKAQAALEESERLKGKVDQQRAWFEDAIKNRSLKELEEIQRSFRAKAAGSASAPTGRTGGVGNGGAAPVVIDTYPE